MANQSVAKVSAAVVVAAGLAVGGYFMVTTTLQADVAKVEAPAAEKAATCGAQKTTAAGSACSAEKTAAKTAACASCAKKAHKASGACDATKAAVKTTAKGTCPASAVKTAAAAKSAGCSDQASAVKVSGTGGCGTGATTSATTASGACSGKTVVKKAAGKAAGSGCCAEGKATKSAQTDVKKPAVASVIKTSGK